METTDIEKKLLALYGNLWRYAYSLTHDSDRANDLMQETALKVLVGKKKFRNGIDFEKWVRVIMRNSHINSANREKRMFAVGELDSLGSIDDAQQAPARNMPTNDYNDICNAVNSLPAGRRETMTMLIHGHKYNEIAFVMNVPIGTVKSRINYSRVVLKEILKDYIN
ncbi:MAG: RNA polymerase sigma factor [Bacteroidaceae bacterium]|nr:RNA polymerase sigma factor [Bacteroidaceae bacterium]